MKRLHRSLPVVVAFVSASAGAQQSATSTKFTAGDVFDLEWVSDPQISPNGRRVVFVRTGYDIRKDGSDRHSGSRTPTEASYAHC